MRRTLLALLIAASPAIAVAQSEKPGVFEDYASFEAFVTSSMAKGEVLELLARMTDLSQLAVAQRAQLEQQMAERWPGTYPNTAVMKDEALGEFSREVRAFWTNEGRYGFFYAYMHRLPGGGIQVVHFGVSTDINEIFKAF